MEIWEDAAVEYECKREEPIGLKASRSNQKGWHLRSRGTGEIDQEMLEDRMFACLRTSQERLAYVHWVKLLV